MPWSLKIYPGLFFELFMQKCLKTAEICGFWACWILLKYPQNFLEMAEIRDFWRLERKDTDIAIKRLKIQTIHNPKWYGGGVNIVFLA